MSSAVTCLSMLCIFLSVLIGFLAGWFESLIQYSIIFSHVNSGLSLVLILHNEVIFMDYILFINCSVSVSRIDLHYTFYLWHSLRNSVRTFSICGV